MSAVLDLPATNTPTRSAVINLPCEKVILHNITWATYESLLAEQPEVAGLHFYYNDGDLEIMTESYKHGKISSLLELIVVGLADELEIDFVPAGETIFKRKDQKKGFEGDGSFYFENAAQVRAKDEIDLAKDPPPELVIEVDITHPSLPKFPIFAGIGVLEIWRYDGFNVKIYRLEGEDYIETQESICLPKVKSEVVTRLLEASFETPRKQFREMIKRSIEE
ncbi:Uma2 family endonuclease [soil metagenome]